MARKITDQAHLELTDLITRTTVSISKRIRLACAHKLRSVDYSVKHVVLDRPDRKRFVSALVKALRCRGFGVRWSNTKRTFTVRW